MDSGFILEFRFESKYPLNQRFIKLISRYFKLVFGEETMTRRSQMEIYIDILRAVADGKKKPTHIMYRANLSWTRLKRYINFLMSQSLLSEEINEGTTVFSLTQKGKEVIGYFKMIEGELYHKKKALPSEVYVQYQ